MPQENKYIIIREDLLLDPVTIITDGLLIGRLQECELLLNHPSVSRVQAGIKAIEGNYYLFNLRPSNPVIINGRPIEENEALATGDTLDVGPFQLDVDRQPEGLYLTVTLRIAAQPELADASTDSLTTQNLIPVEQATEGATKKRAPRAA